MRRGLAAAALGLSLVAGEAAGVERLPALLHVHSDLSTGDLGLDALAGRAEREGIGALLLAENYLLRVEYGLPPFRALTRVVREERSVLLTGTARYLARVAEAQARHPRVLLVAGVEVVPHYRWDSEAWGLDLTLRDTQKNLLVFGIDDPAALAALPVAGNPARVVFTWAAVLDALPALLVVPGLWLVVRRRRRLVRVGRTMRVIQRRRWLTGGLLCVVGLVALARAWPLGRDPLHPYADRGLGPHQALIDHVERLGGATVWSFPEARDAGERWLGPIRVAWRTDPYADDLLRTSRYTAFGALYADTTRFERPGGGWDRLLAEYVAGERSRPAWGVGEAGFHGFAGGATLGTIQTVFLDTAPTRAGVLEALRQGRLYALQRTPAASLILGGFAATTAGAAAGPGGTLRVAAGTPLAVQVDVQASGPVGDLRVTLVRNGAVAGVWSGAAPLRAIHREVFDGRPAYFRVDVRAATPHRLLPSPLFVRPP